jgi:hypothetical protein
MSTQPIYQEERKDLKSNEAKRSERIYLTPIDFDSACRLLESYSNAVDPFIINFRSSEQTWKLNRKDISIIIISIILATLVDILGYSLSIIFLMPISFISNIISDKVINIIYQNTNFKRQKGELFTVYRNLREYYKEFQLIANKSHSFNERGNLTLWEKMELGVKLRRAEIILQEVRAILQSYEKLLPPGVDAIPDLDEIEELENRAAKP